VLYPRHVASLATNKGSSARSARNTVLYRHFLNGGAAPDYRRRRRSTAASMLRSLCHDVCEWVCGYVCMGGMLPR